MTALEIIGDGISDVARFSSLTSSTLATFETETETYKIGLVDNHFSIKNLISPTNTRVVIGDFTDEPDTILTINTSNEQSAVVRLQSTDLLSARLEFNDVVLQSSANNELEILSKDESVMKFIDSKLIVSPSGQLIVGDASNSEANVVINGESGSFLVDYGNQKIYTFSIPTLSVESSLSFVSFEYSGNLYAKIIVCCERFTFVSEIILKQETEISEFILIEPIFRSKISFDANITVKQDIYDDKSIVLFGFQNATNFPVQDIKIDILVSSDNLLSKNDITQDAIPELFVDTFSENVSSFNNLRILKELSIEGDIKTNNISWIRPLVVSNSIEEFTPEPVFNFETSTLEEQEPISEHYWRLNYGTKVLSGILMGGEIKVFHVNTEGILSSEAQELTKPTDGFLVIISHEYPDDVEFLHVIKNTPFYCAFVSSTGEIEESRNNLATWDFGGIPSIRPPVRRLLDNNNQTAIDVTNNVVNFRNPTTFTSEVIFNDKVGIGTGDPQVALDIRGDVFIGGNRFIYSDKFSRIIPVEVNSDRLKCGNRDVLDNIFVEDNHVWLATLAPGTDMIYTIHPWVIIDNIPQNTAFSNVAVLSELLSVINNLPEETVYFIGYKGTIIETSIIDSIRITAMNLGLYQLSQVRASGGYVAIGVVGTEKTVENFSIEPKISTWIIGEDITAEGPQLRVDTQDYSIQKTDDGLVILNQDGNKATIECSRIIGRINAENIVGRVSMDNLDIDNIGTGLINEGSVTRSKLAADVNLKNITDSVLEINRETRVFKSIYNVEAPSFTGSGAGLTSIHGSNIQNGTISADKLSSDVNIRSISGQKIELLNNNLIFHSPIVASSFTGNGSGLTDINGSNIRADSISKSSIGFTINDLTDNIININEGQKRVEIDQEYSLLGNFSVDNLEDGSISYSKFDPNIDWFQRFTNGEITYNNTTNTLAFSGNITATGKTITASKFTGDGSGITGISGFQLQDNSITPDKLAEDVNLSSITGGAIRLISGLELLEINADLLIKGTLRVDSIEMFNPNDVTGIRVHACNIVGDIESDQLGPIPVSKLSETEGFISNEMIALNTITSDKIKSLSASKLQGFIPASIIPEGFVTNVMIADNAVLTQNIDDGSVTDEKVVSISYSKIDWKAQGDAELSVPDGGIEGRHIANGAITTSKIQNGSITAQKIASRSIRVSHLDETSINLDYLSNNALKVPSIGGILRIERPSIFNGDVSVRGNISASGTIGGENASFVGDGSLLTNVSMNTETIDKYFGRGASELSFLKKTTFTKDVTINGNLHVIGNLTIRGSNSLIIPSNDPTKIHPFTSSLGADGQTMVVKTSTTSLDFFAPDNPNIPIGMIGIGNNPLGTTEESMVITGTNGISIEAGTQNNVNISLKTDGELNIKCKKFAVQSLETNKEVFNYNSNYESIYTSLPWYGSLTNITPKPQGINGLISDYQTDLGEIIIYSFSYDDSVVDSERYLTPSILDTNTRARDITPLPHRELYFSNMGGVRKWVLDSSDKTGLVHFVKVGEEDVPRKTYLMGEGLIAINTNIVSPFYVFEMEMKTSRTSSDIEGNLNRKIRVWLDEQVLFDENSLNMDTNDNSDMKFLKYVPMTKPFVRIKIEYDMWEFEETIITYYQAS